MPAFISFLRGINVGGHHLIPMSELRAVYESLGLQNPQTLLQSGNVVFRANARNAESLRKRIEDAIENKYGFRPVVVVRTPAELRSAVANTPFAKRRGLDPARYVLMFLAAEPTPAACARLAAIPAEPEEAFVRGREVYAYFPNGFARPKLAAALIEKTLGVSGTARNWNTIGKLLEIVEAMDEAAIL